MTTTWTRWITASVVVLTLTGIRSDACGVIYSFIDLPTEGAVVPASAFRVVGWALECASGTRPPAFSLALWNLDTNQWWIPKSTKVQPASRPDVAVAYRSLCPVSNATGYVATVSQVPPTGHYRLYVNWANYYGARDTKTKDIDIVP